MNDHNTNRACQNIEVSALDQNQNLSSAKSNVIKVVVSPNTLEIPSNSLSHQSRSFGVSNPNDFLSAAVKNPKKSNKRKRNVGKGQKKNKKTPEEISILEKYFETDPSWGRKTVKILKTTLTRLSVDQIYKWGYDRKLLIKKNSEKKRMQKDAEKQLKSLQFEIPSEANLNATVEEIVTTPGKSESDETPLSDIQRKAGPRKFKQLLPFSIETFIIN